MLKRWIIFGLTLICALSLLTACAPEVIPTPTLTPTPTPTATGPVKIAGITAWSGPAGMSGAMGDVCMNLVEYQVNDLMGGILGGRELDLIGCDSRSTTAGCIACANQMLYEENVAAIAWGGFTGADALAIIDFSEENELPYFFWGGLPPNICDKKFCVRNSHSLQSITSFADDYIKLFHPETVACLAYDTADARAYMNGWIGKYEDSGAEIIYEEYNPPTTTDFTSYLTTIKHLNPDVLMLIQSNEGYVAMAKQVVGLGGLGDITVVCDPPVESAMSEEGAQGWYAYVFWYPGFPYSGTEKFEEDYKALYGVTPTVTFLALYYDCLWPAINAIELAGTDDRVKVAEAARSGNLEFESPTEFRRYDTCGEPGHLAGFYVQIKDKKLVPVQVPE
jgi:ABC-type branched-subunit amino acid transport system substrate-binding protein